LAQRKHALADRFERGDPGGQRAHIRHGRRVDCVPWPVLLIDPAAHRYPFTYSRDDVHDLASLATTGGISDRLAAWSAGFEAGPTTDTLSLLKDLNAGILGSMRYRMRDEEGTQTPDETLALASGSCRDIAALFIEAARHLGFGARAVSGYLYDPDVIAADGGATHAWAESFLPGKMDSVRSNLPADGIRPTRRGCRRQDQSPDHASPGWLCRRS
jgi:transglutaminase-like putative cysteine protease